jgi:hypothetical protein
MGKCNKSDYNHVLYNQNRARAKSGDKLKNVIEHAILLKKKAHATGDSKWLTNAWMKLNAKMKRHGITEAMINVVIERK